MAWKLTIAGTDKTTSLRMKDRVSADFTLNERASLRFTCLSGYVPARWADVVAYAQDGVTPIFGGVVKTRRSKADFEGIEPYFTDVECADYGIYAAWCYQTKTYGTGPTLKAVLQDLVADKLTAYGITLDAGQVDGPTLGTFAWTNMRVDNALRELSDRTGYVWEVSPAKALRMYVPGTDAAPYTMTDAATNCLDVHWEDVGDAVVNKVVLLCGPSGTWEARQLWIANGTDTSWVTDLPAADPPPPLVEVDDGTNPAYLATVGIGSSGGGMFNWDRDTHTLSDGTATRPTSSPPPAGTRICLGPQAALGDTYTTQGYTAQGPFTVTSTAAGSPVVEKVFSDPSVTSLAQGQEVADGILAQLGTATRQLSVKSDKLGWAQGQALTVDLTARGIDAAFVITSVGLTLISDAYWRYDLTADEASVYGGSYLQRWREMAGGGSSTGVSVGGNSAVPPATPAYLGGSRFHAVQVPA